MTFPRQPPAEYRTVTERKCGGCGRWLPHDSVHFHRNRTSSTGLQTHCKTCQRAHCKDAARDRFQERREAANAGADLDDAWPRQQYKNAWRKAKEHDRTQV